MKILEYVNGVLDAGRRPGFFGNIIKMDIDKFKEKVFGRCKGKVLDKKAV
jgi:hypothetical protein